MSALQGIRIVELAERAAGEYCGKLLADLGADVIKVERPDTGSPTRAMSPLVPGVEGVEASGLFAYLNTNKKSVALDIGSDAGREAIAALIANADVVIDDHPETWLDALGLQPETLERDHPSLTLCSITPFGQGAPADWYPVESLNTFNAGGWGYHTPSGNRPDRPPLKAAGRFLMEYEAALDAALCVVASVIRQKDTGLGRFIDIAEQDVMISRCDTIVGVMITGEDKPRKDRSAYDMPSPATTFACKDGYLYLFITTKRHWAALRQMMDNPAWMEEYPEDWLEFGMTAERIAGFRAGFGAWVADKERNKVSEEGQRLGLPLTPLSDAVDVLEHAQLNFRGYFQSLKHPQLGEQRYPTAAYKLGASPVQLNRAAPSLGQDGNAIAQWSDDGESRNWPSRQSPANTVRRRGGPLEGVRVLEMTKVWAGPYAGKLLALLGAEVIKVESNSKLDEMRAYGGSNINRAPYFLSLNPEVLSVQVNMKSEEGLQYLREMIAKSDIVLDNLRPGALERAGLGYEELCKIRPDIISVSIKMFGNDGPFGYQTGFAPSFAALGGLSYLVGYEGGPPEGMNIRYGDATVGANAAFGAIAALAHRNRTGQGQFVDVSAVESLSSMVGDSLFEYSLTGRLPGPEGNFHPDMAPHGCYPCGEGDWISIAVPTDQAWLALCTVLEDGELARDSRFATLADRQANRIALDDRLAALTQAHDPAVLAASLRRAGVPAFKSRTAVDVANDDTLWARGIYSKVSDHENGTREIVATPWRMSRDSARIERGAPLLGEHNDYVYCDVLGVSRERVDELIASKAID